METVPFSGEAFASRDLLKDRLPDFAELHLRHPGLTPALCHCYAEAAGVCLSRHHESPVVFRLTCDSTSSQREAFWPLPTSRMVRAWANRDEATRDGAYAVALAAIEAELGFLAIERADTGTGADYFIATDGEEDLEWAYRLEVSGTDQVGERVFRSRLSAKILQVKNGNHQALALVVVVGFGARRIAMKVVRED